VADLPTKLPTCLASIRRTLHRTIRHCQAKATLAVSERSEVRSEEVHDFILAQASLPPDLMRKAVMKDFAPMQK
jgi:hypothetical protein